MMNRLFIVLATFLLLSTSVYADKLMWDEPTSGTPAGYMVYYNEFSMDVGFDNFEVELNLIPELTYQLSCTAYNTLGTEISYTRPAFTMQDNPAPLIINIPPGAPVTIYIGE